MRVSVLTWLLQRVPSQRLAGAVIVAMCLVWMPLHAFETQVQISLSKTTTVNISNIDDVDLGFHPGVVGGRNIRGSDRVCIFSQTGSYQITFEQAGGRFVLVGHQSGYEIPYTVQFQGGGRPISAVPGIPIAGTRADAVDILCSGNTNARFLVNVLTSDFNPAAVDSYAAVLEILVEPE